MDHTIAALSMSTKVARAIRQEGWTGEVMAVHPQSVYVTDEDDEIYAIVRQPLGNGPLNLVIPVEPAQLFNGLALGTSLASTGAILGIGDGIMIGLNGAAVWESKARAALAADGELLDRGLAVLCREISQCAPAESLARLLPHLEDEDLPDPLERVAHFPRSHALIGGLAESLAQRDRRRLKVVTSSLAGLGPGLTPAGDDFIAGVLLALALVRAQRGDPALNEIAHLLVETAAPRTHEISAAYLRAAYDGQASERWDPLLAALAAGDADQIAAAAMPVLATGETSGADMLAGFVVGIGALQGGPTAMWRAPVPAGGPAASSTPLRPAG
ncbi:MAG TPA: DUF2877 domain-containing protein [bacterium]|nr:DUF2877 domain-containing protein [bacterium]